VDRNRKKNVNKDDICSVLYCCSVLQLVTCLIHVDRKWKNSRDVNKEDACSVLHCCSVLHSVAFLIRVCDVSHSYV